ncbi:MAG: class I SAM-dependent methyltransferase [Anaerolineales bacterium]
MPLLSAFLRRQRLRAAAPYIRGDVLDIGCGKADILADLDPEQAYVGIEGHPGIYHWLVENLEGYEFHRLDLDNEDIMLDREFDTVLMLAVIEHLKNPSRLLDRIPQLLRPKGRAILTTPSPMGDTVHKLGTRIGLFSQIAAEEHETVYEPRTLIEQLIRSDLKLEHYRSFLLGGNQLFVCSPILRSNANSPAP